VDKTVYGRNKDISNAMPWRTMVDKSKEVDPIVGGTFKEKCRCIGLRYGH
jgi:hypothetical protein